MKIISDPHEQAMGLVVDGNRWRSCKQSGLAEDCFRKAAELEAKAAFAATDDSSRAALFLSAARIMRRLKFLHAPVVELLLHGLAGNPPPEIREEMLVIYRELFKDA